MSSEKRVFVTKIPVSSSQEQVEQFFGSRLKQFQIFLKEGSIVGTKIGFLNYKDDVHEEDLIQEFNGKKLNGVSIELKNYVENPNKVRPVHHNGTQRGFSSRSSIKSEKQPNDFHRPKKFLPNNSAPLSYKGKVTQVSKKPVGGIFLYSEQEDHVFASLSEWMTTSRHLPEISALNVRCGGRYGLFSQTEEGWIRVCVTNITDSVCEAYAIDFGHHLFASVTDLVTLPSHVADLATIVSRFTIDTSLFRISDEDKLYEELESLVDKDITLLSNCVDSKIDPILYHSIKLANGLNFTIHLQRKRIIEPIITLQDDSSSVVSEKSFVQKVELLSQVTLMRAVKPYRILFSYNEESGEIISQLLTDFNNSFHSDPEKFREIHELLNLFNDSKTRLQQLKTYLLDAIQTGAEIEDFLRERDSHAENLLSYMERLKSVMKQKKEISESLMKLEKFTQAITNLCREFQIKVDCSPDVSCENENNESLLEIINDDTLKINLISHQKKTNAAKLELASCLNNWKTTIDSFPKFTDQKEELENWDLLQITENFTKALQDELGFYKSSKISESVELFTFFQHNINIIQSKIHSMRSIEEFLDLDTASVIAKAKTLLETEEESSRLVKEYQDVQKKLRMIKISEFRLEAEMLQIDDLDENLREAKKDDIQSQNMQIMSEKQALSIKAGELMDQLHLKSEERPEIMSIFKELKLDSWTPNVYPFDKNLVQLKQLQDGTASAVFKGTNVLIKIFKLSAPLISILTEWCREYARISQNFQEALAIEAMYKIANKKTVTGPNIIFESPFPQESVLNDVELCVDQLSLLNGIKILRSIVHLSFAWAPLLSDNCTTLCWLIPGANLQECFLKIAPPFPHEIPIKKNAPLAETKKFILSIIECLKIANIFSQEEMSPFFNWMPSLCQEGQVDVFFDSWENSIPAPEEEP